MKKELLISIGSITTTLLVNKLYKQYNKKKQKRILEEEPFQILDPFVNYYYWSTDIDEHFKKVISERMTLDEVKLLKSVFKKREESLRGEETIAYYHFLRIIDQYLPVESSLKSLEESNQKNIPRDMTEEDLRDLDYLLEETE
ncbi:hypothetical protein ACFJX1_01515 [Enterococcus faecalis]|uniref:hypothetical protein n=1 Tax=Enterococcus faecalis TaxID=1351 RepID=UPI0004487DD5|nr:hypothetical protein [Enterococcus faecalis]ETT95484.1 hypothetical protein P003_02990 [Enterococcus faecalis EnGen0403]ETU00515.1 hypothetical protein P004_03017 [Enterococcus faecalis EnGen0404]ETU01047.1 hypothetical protein P005_02986 [Enterococcus faecalis EnGen0405]ETU11975.1 hypothetical protein P008_03078 [Enterococcus faecalis EnGen0408]HAP4915452.1 hypothetical protein [Enterococcus faecalis]